LSKSLALQNRLETRIKDLTTTNARLIESGRIEAEIKVRFQTVNKHQTVLLKKFEAKIDSLQ
jgi:hypothetical protein